MSYYPPLVLRELADRSAFVGFHGVSPAISQVPSALSSPPNLELHFGSSSSAEPVVALAAPTHNGPTHNGQYIFSSTCLTDTSSPCFFNAVASSPSPVAMISPPMEPVMEDGDGMIGTLTISPSVFPHDDTRSTPYEYSFTDSYDHDKDDNKEMTLEVKIEAVSPEAHSPISSMASSSGSVYDPSFSAGPISARLGARAAANKSSKSKPVVNKASRKNSKSVKSRQGMVRKDQNRKAQKKYRSKRKSQEELANTFMLKVIARARQRLDLEISPAEHWEMLRGDIDLVMNEYGATAPNAADHLENQLAHVLE